MSMQEAERRIAECRETQNPVLNLNCLGLTHLPSSIFSLTHLLDLDLSQNQLHVLPDIIGKLTVLRILDLSENPIRTLPETIGKLTEVGGDLIDVGDITDAAGVAIGKAIEQKTP